MAEPAFVKHKEALRQNIAQAVERAYLAMGPKGNKIDWFITQESSGKKS